MATQMIYLDGKMVPEPEAKVSVYDHGLLYGDGVFEGIRMYSGKVFRLKEHVRRLYDSAQAIKLEIPMPQAEMCAVVVDTCKANSIVDGYIRLVVTRGKGDLGLDPRKCPKPTVFCIAGTISLYPKEFYEKGMKLVSVAVPRMANEALNPQVKSLNYLNNILAKIECINAGAVEALMINPNGYVAECTGDNIFFVRDGVLKTPHPSAGALKGITRDAVMELARKLGLTVEEPDVTRYDIYTASECFVTGTGAELVPIIEVDGRKIGDGKPGPITLKLLEAFHKMVRE